MYRKKPCYYLMLAASAMRLGQYQLADTHRNHAKKLANKKVKVKHYA